MSGLLYLQILGLILSVYLCCCGVVRAIGRERKVSLAFAADVQAHSQGSCISKMYDDNHKHDDDKRKK